MIVNDLDLQCVRAPPNKAHSVAVVDSNAVLIAPITLQLFESQTSPNRKIMERSRGIENNKFLKS
jgi:hypothetical protein